MAGIIHEVERTDLLEQVRQEAASYSDFST